jgi:hypothetical protein
MHIRYRAAAFAVAVVGLVGGGMTAASATGDHKTSICHRTASDTNPYVFETVDNHALQAHLTNGKGHFPKQWKSDGSWRGVAHVAGDPKNDYIATSAADCQDTTQGGEDQPTVVVPLLPVTTEADCDTDGSLTIPVQPEHVTVDPSAGTYGPGDYTVTFTAENDGDVDHDDFVFANGESTMVVQVQVDAATGDCPTPTPEPKPQPKPKPHHPHHEQPKPHTTPNVSVPVVVEAGL